MITAPNVVNICTMRWGICVRAKEYAKEKSNKMKWPMGSKQWTLRMPPIPAIVIMHGLPLDSRKCTHGDRVHPSNWPWWKFCAFSWLALPSVHKPSTAHRLWIYTLTKAHDFDITFDRRGWVNTENVATYSAY